MIPNVEVTKFVPDEMAEYTATADILPEIKLGDYKKLKAAREAIEVKKAEIDEVLENVRNAYAEHKAGKKTAEMGDEVVIDFEGSVDGVKFDGGASGFFQIAFDEDGELQGIIPVVSLSSISSSSFTDGMAFTVTGDMAANSSSGLYFGSASNVVAIASGSYIYTHYSQSSAVKLGNDTDTLYALADAAVLNLGGTSGAITDALNGTSSTGDDFTYQYRSGGSAYFTVGAIGASALSAFVFGTVDDAIGMSSGNTLRLEYLNNGTASALVNVPVVTGSASYWVEMTGASGSEFEVNTFGGAASIAVGSASFTFTGGTSSSEFLFNAGGSALGFDAATGSVAMNTDAANFLDGGYFAINGASVDIAAQNIIDSKLVYIASESALLGLGDGSDIDNAGNITKIYAASSAATFTFGSTSFTADAAGTSTGDLAYYDVNGASATGFHFMLTNDALTLPGSVSGFSLYDGANGTGFDAPTVSVTAGGSEVSSYTVVKQAGDSLFAVADLADDNYAEFGQTHITFETLSAATGEILFTAPSGALVGISGLVADNDAVRVTGATGGISIMGKTVEIVGGNCYIRSEPGINGAVLGVAKRGTTHTFGGEIAQNGWIRIRHGDGTAWVSGKYAKLKG